MKIQKALNMLPVVVACGVVLVCCRDARAWAVPDTGQTKCYDNASEITCPQPAQSYYGQDGTYSINAPSYTKLDASGAALPDSAENWAMVRDEVTGLVWEEKHSLGGGANYSDPNDADNLYTWYDNNSATNGGTPGTPGNGTDTMDVINTLNAINYGSHSDWRLPTRAELQSLVNYSNFDPANNTVFFPDTQAFGYWSSSPGETVYAWYIDFYEGIVSTQGKDAAIYVRAVRGGKSSYNFIDNTDGTVTDMNTGLMWQQATAPGTYTWKQALAYCDNTTLAGHTDWRLPTSKELHSIVDNSKYNIAIDTAFFPDTHASSYWTSSTYADNPGYAWDVNFYGGYVMNNYDKDLLGYVRSVRLGQVFPSTSTTTAPPCIDNDGDDYGVNCAKGMDCNDNDSFYNEICPDCAVKVIPQYLGWFLGENEKTRRLLVIGNRDTVLEENTPVRWETSYIEVLSQRVFFKRFMFMKVSIDGADLDKGEYRALIGNCTGNVTLVK